MTAIELACRHVQPDGINCGAEAGELCVWHDWAHAVPHPDFHSEREQDAAGVGVPDSNVSQAAYEKACERVMDEVA